MTIVEILGADLIIVIPTLAPNRFTELIFSWRLFVRFALVLMPDHDTQ